MGGREEGTEGAERRRESKQEDRDNTQKLARGKPASWKQGHEELMGKSPKE